MKIAFFEIENWENKYLKKNFPKDKLTFSTGKLTPSNAGKYKDFECVAVFINSKVDKKVLDKLPNLKLVTTMSTGYDHIDLEECKKRGIKVTNVPVYGMNTVAEHTFSLILGLSRRLVECVERTRSGKFYPKGLMGFDLKGKTLGVIGTGNIGYHVAKMGRGFEMNVVAFDVVKNMKNAKKLGYKYVSFDKLLKVSDIVTLHAPYNKHTHHMLNGKKIKLMKKGSILINTARGGLVDSIALMKALKSGRIAAVGLDVLEEEKALAAEERLAHKKGWIHKDTPVLKVDYALLKMENVLVTPHNAFNTKEAILRIVGTTVDNINGLKKKKFVNVVV